MEVRKVTAAWLVLVVFPLAIVALAVAVYVVTGRRGA
jgi:hypothetical protein